jgi:hypothetical protein
VTEQASEGGEDIKRGPKGGRKHKPGHDRKSRPAKKKRIGKRLRDRRKQREEEAKRKQEEFEQLSPDAQRILKKPKVRPSTIRGKK